MLLHAVALRAAGRLAPAETLALAEGEVDADGWEQTLCARAGGRAGAWATLTWERRRPAELQLEVWPGGALPQLRRLLPVLGAAAGMMLASSGVGPLASLPGQRLAAALGGTGGLVVAQGALLLHARWRRWRGLAAEERLAAALVEAVRAAAQQAPELEVLPVDGARD